LKLELSVESVRHILAKYKDCLKSFEKDIIDSIDYNPYENKEYVSLKIVINELSSKLEKYIRMSKLKE
jgi:hypothetical protein